MKRRMMLIAVLVPVLGVALLVLRAELAARETEPPRGCGSSEMPR